MSNADSDARAEAASALEDLQQRLEKEEKQSEQYKKQVEVLQAKLDDAVKDSAKLEEKSHEYEEQIEALKNEKREATRQIREMESIYEAEKSSILKEKEEMANREEEMQTVIQRLKDSLAQRNNNDDETRPSRPGWWHSCLVLTTFGTHTDLSSQATPRLHSRAAALPPHRPSNAAIPATAPNSLCRKISSSSPSA